MYEYEDTYVLVCGHIYSSLSLSLSLSLSDCDEPMDHAASATCSMRTQMCEYEDTCTSMRTHMY
jgi:hypothetical protein